MFWFFFFWLLTEGYSYPFLQLLFMGDGWKQSWGGARAGRACTKALSFFCAHLGFQPMRPLGWDVCGVGMEILETCFQFQRERLMFCPPCSTSIFIWLKWSSLGPQIKTRWYFRSVKGEKRCMQHTLVNQSSSAPNWEMLPFLQGWKGGRIFWVLSRTLWASNLRAVLVTSVSRSFDCESGLYSSGSLQR